MKKFIAGLAVGMAVGFAPLFFVGKPEGEVCRREEIVVERDCYSVSEARYVGSAEEPKPPAEIVVPEDMDEYGSRIYSEIYDGDCVSLEGLASAAGQVEMVNREYGIEKAKLLYSSLGRNWKGGSRRVCGLGYVNFEAVISSGLSLEDFWRLRHNFSGEFPDEAYDVYELTSYLDALSPDVREGYIREICEGKVYVFSDPRYVLEKKDGFVLCTRIFSDFPEQFLDSVSWADEVPELALAYEYKDLVEQARDERCQAFFGEGVSFCVRSGTDIEMEFAAKLAKLACERLSASDFSLEEIVDAIGENISLANRNYFLRGRILEEARMQCGRSER